MEEKFLFASLLGLKQVGTSLGSEKKPIVEDIFVIGALKISITKFGFCKGTKVLEGDPPKGIKER